MSVSLGISGLGLELRGFRVGLYYGPELGIKSKEHTCFRGFANVGVPFVRETPFWENQAILETGNTHV